MSSKSETQARGTTSSQACPGSRSGRSTPSSKPELLPRPKSTSPRIQKKAMKSGDPQTKNTPNRTAIGAREKKTIPRSSSSSGILESTKKPASPGSTRKNSIPSGVRPSSRGGSTKSVDSVGSATTEKSSLKSSDSLRKKNRSPTGEEAKKKPKSVVDRKLSPLSQRRATAGQSKSMEESKLKKPGQSSSPSTVRKSTGGGAGARPARSGIAEGSASKAREETRQKKSNPSIAHKKVSTGKPPSGAGAASAAKSKQSKSVAGGNVGEGTGASDPTSSGRSKSESPKKTLSRGSSPIEKEEKDQNAAEGTNEDLSSEKKPPVKKSTGVGGTESHRKSSLEKRPGSAGSSPSSERKTSTSKRPGGASPGNVRRSASFRRVGSSGSIPVQKISAENKVSPGTGRRASGERKMSSESLLKAPEKEGLNATGRRSLRSRSDINVGSSAPKKSETRSTGRKLSAPSSAQGSPSPNALQGKVITLDHKDLQNEDRIQTTLKHFIGKGSASGGAKKASKGPVVKTMGVTGGTSTSARSTPVTSGRSTPVKRVSSPAKSPVFRTGSGSVVKKPNTKSNVGSRDRLHSSDDVLKISPSDAAPSLRATSPLTVSAKSDMAKTRGSGAVSPVKKEIALMDKTGEKAKNPAKARGSGAVSPVKKNEKEIALMDKTGEKVKNPAKARLGIVSRPSCRNTEVKTRIKHWEKESVSGEKGSISPIPSSPKTPDTPSSHLSSSGKFSLSAHTSPHASPVPSPIKTTPPPSSPHALADHSPHTTPVTSPPPQKQHSSSPSRTSYSPSPVRSPVNSSPRHARSRSPVVISSSGAPVKSRIAMWAEKEKEAREAREAQKSLSPQHSPQHSSVSSPKGPRSPHSSPRVSPNSSPSALRKQSPAHPVSPARSTESSGAGSVVSTKASSASPPRQVPSIKVEEKEGREIPKKATSAPAGKVDDDDMYEDVVSSPRKSVTVPATGTDEVYEIVEAAEQQQEFSIPNDIYSTIPEMYGNFPKGNHLHEVHVVNEEPPKLPPRPDFIMQEGDMHVQDIEDDTTLFDDKKGSSEMKPGHTETPILDGQPASDVKDTEYNRQPPAYVEIPILDGPSSSSGLPATSGSPLHKSVSNLTPKTKRRWLRSPFGRRKGSAGDVEDTSSDRERDEDKKKKKFKIGTRKDNKATKQKPKTDDRFSPPAAAGKTSFDSDSDASSNSQEAPQNTLTVPNAEESRTRSSTEIKPEEDLRPEVIPRASSYSPAGTPNALTTHKKLDPLTQRVVSSDPSLSENSPEANEELPAEHMVTTHRKFDPTTQRVGSDPSLAQNQSSGTPHVKSSSSNRNSDISNDIRSIIDNMGGDSEFCEMYTRKLSSLPGRAEPKSGGSSPGGIRLPVPFQLKSGSSHPNLVRVGFDLPPDSETKSSFLSNGVRGRGDEGSESSTGSEVEEHGSSGMEEEEEEEDRLASIETSLDRGNVSRNDIKRKLSESSDKGLRLSPKKLPNGDNQNSDNLVATSLMYADAVWDRVAHESDELSFRVGDVIEILDMSDDMWWQGSVQEKSGWFPSSFVRLRIAQDEEDDDIYAIPPDAEQGGGTLPRVTTMPSGDSSSYATYGRTSKSKRRMTIRRRDSVQSMPRKLTPSEVRSKVVEEILNTERDYVKHLEDIIEGFLKKCRLDTKLFDKEKVEIIFSNIESLYKFQMDFLSMLEARVIPAHMEDSQIGEVFLRCRDGFSVYSEYCNNHPHAVNEMCLLQKKDQYALFFESCRLLRNLQNIPLEGFLLLPVQKICKYPLQLSELLKYTSEDHPDRRPVEEAVEAMRQVATHINEGKRRLENIGRIGKWQESIDGWKGPDIVETSSEMIHSSELHKISKGHSQERHFFLFDSQLIYCKKDVMGGKLCYKGRLAMETVHITDLPDGQVTHNGAPVKNAWKMDNQAKGKDYIIYARTPEVKMKWMDAFQREKERVAEDKENGFSVSLKMKRAAAALCSSNTRVSVSKRRSKSFNKKTTLRVQALSESMDSAAKKVDGSPARERKKFAKKFFNQLS